MSTNVEGGKLNSAANYSKCSEKKKKKKKKKEPYDTVH
jgi:hypothetical protein